MTVQFNFDNSYGRLPERFFTRMSPTPVSAPTLVKINEDLARELIVGFVCIETANHIITVPPRTWPSIVIGKSITVCITNNI